jgi:hypothetical protein
VNFSDINRFLDEIKYIVFSAFWNIPRSWLRMGLQHVIHRNKNYLRRNNMEIAGYSSGLQVIRHKPGKSNDVNVIIIKRKNAARDKVNLENGLKVRLNQPNINLIFR